jgi:hypothetical protein
LPFGFLRNDQASRKLPEAPRNEIPFQGASGKSQGAIDFFQSASITMPLKITSEINVTKL